MTPSIRTKCKDCTYKYKTLICHAAVTSISQMKKKSFKRTWDQHSNVKLAPFSALLQNLSFTKTCSNNTVPSWKMILIFYNFLLANGNKQYVQDNGVTWPRLLEDFSQHRFFFFLMTQTKGLVMTRSSLV